MIVYGFLIELVSLIIKIGSYFFIFKSHISIFPDFLQSAKLHELKGFQSKSTNSSFESILFKVNKNLLCYSCQIFTV